MENKNYVGLMAVSRETGVPYWRIRYAHLSGALPWPARVVNTWAYGPEDIDRIASYFAVKKDECRKTNPTVRRAGD